MGVAIRLDLLRQQAGVGTEVDADAVGGLEWPKRHRWVHTGTGAYPATEGATFVVSLAILTWIQQMNWRCLQRHVTLRTHAR